MHSIVHNKLITLINNKFKLRIVHDEMIKKSILLVFMLLIVYDRNPSFHE